MDDPIDFYPYTTPDTTRLPELALQTLSDNISVSVPTVFRWYIIEYQKGFVTAVGFSICQVTSSGELAILQLPDKAIGSGVELRSDGVWTLMMVNNEPYADQVSEEDAVGFERLTASWVVRSYYYSTTDSLSLKENDVTTSHTTTT